MTTIGIDPGADHGACAVHSALGWAVLGWRRIGRRSTREVRWSTPAGEVNRWTSGDVHEDLLQWLSGRGPHPVTLAVEAVTVQRGKGSPIVLAEAAGAALAVARLAAHPARVLRPTPYEWRRAVLGLTSGAGDDLDRAVLAAVRGVEARGRATQVDLGVGWVGELTTHEGDAIALAVYAGQEEP